MNELSPTEKLNLISLQGVEGTPQEVMLSALIQHFKEDAQFQNNTESSMKVFHTLLTSINEKLTPISATYDTVGTIRRWAMGLLLAVSLASGSVYAIIQSLPKGK